MPILTPVERIGTRLAGRYRFERILAYGGMGVLFAGFDSLADRPVAIKLLKSTACDDPGRQARFVRESETAGTLHHPNIVEVYDAGKAPDGTGYLVMPLLQGRSLEDELRRCGRLSPERCLALLLPVMGAVGSAHEMGIIHRDLKPSNIFLHQETSGAEMPKLLDFGVAKRIEACGMTTTGMVVGTPEYMSPEQACDEWITPATDVWAFGVIFYRCLTGTLPFKATSTPRLLMQLAHARAPRLTARGELPKRLAAAVDKALERDPAARYGSVRELAHALVNTAVADGIGVPSNPDPRGLAELPLWLADAQRDMGTSSRAHAAARRNHVPTLLWASFLTVIAVGVLSFVTLVGGAASPRVPSDSPAVPVAASARSSMAMEHVKPAQAAVAPPLQISVQRAPEAAEHPPPDPPSRTSAQPSRRAVGPKRTQPSGSPAPEAEPHGASTAASSDPVVPSPGRSGMRPAERRRGQSAKRAFDSEGKAGRTSARFAASRPARSESKRRTSDAPEAPISESQGGLPPVRLEW